MFSDVLSSNFSWIFTNQHPFEDGTQTTSHYLFTFYHLLNNFQSLRVQNLMCNLLFTNRFSRIVRLSTLFDNLTNRSLNLLVIKISL